VDAPPIRTLPSTNQIRMRIQGAYEHKKVTPFGDLLTETPSEQPKSIVKIIYFVSKTYIATIRSTQKNRPLVFLSLFTSFGLDF
jgi:hypothetical protein